MQMRKCVNIKLILSEIYIYGFGNPTFPYLQAISIASKNLDFELWTVGSHRIAEHADAVGRLFLSSSARNRILSLFERPPSGTKTQPDQNCRSEWQRLSPGNS